MKLNLVPTHVAKERANGPAIGIAVLLAVVGIVLAVVMTSYSSATLKKSIDAEQDALSRAASVKANSDQADALMADPKTNLLVRDVSLAQAMESHSTVYPDLYDQARRYIPSYFRVTNIAASPAGDDECTLTLVGVVSTYQQYADLGLALMRMPGAEHYTDAGYTVTNKYVPNLTSDSMNGQAIHPGEGNIPDDPSARLDYYQKQGTLTGFQNVGGFGDDSITTKGAMPNASQVTITLTLKSTPKYHYALQTPDPRATLAAAASGASTSTTAAAGAPTGFGAPTAGASTGGAGKASAPPVASASGSGGKAGKDEE